MLTFNHKTTTVTCHPENEAVIREKLAKLKRNTYMTPRTLPEYAFPRFTRGMSTAEYIHAYRDLNARSIYNVSARGFAPEDMVNPEALKRPAPMYDPDTLRCQEWTEAKWIR